MSGKKKIKINLLVEPKRFVFCIGTIAFFYERFFFFFNPFSDSKTIRIFDIISLLRTMRKQYFAL